MAGGSDVLERRVYYAGSRIFREGEPGERAFVVQSGMVEIYKEVDGREIVLGTISEGGIFGEMALIDAAPRMASARAVRNSTIVIVPQTTFKEKLAKADPFIRALLGIFVKNIRSLTSEVVREHIAELNKTNAETAAAAGEKMVE
jgi:CRP-like cAMP-binding protein